LAVAASAAVTALSKILSSVKIEKYRRLSGKLLLIAAGAVGAAVLFGVYLSSADALTSPPDHPHTTYVILALTFGLLLYSRWIDSNATSLHSFYRDRLSKTFLFHAAASGEPVPNDNLKLSKLNQRVAPYHLLNTTLNLAGSDDLDLYGRNSDFF